MKLTNQINSIKSVLFSVALSIFIGDRYFEAMALVNFIRIAEFGFISTVQVMTSSVLRKELQQQFSG